MVIAIIINSAVIMLNPPCPQKPLSVFIVYTHLQ